jgi:hypothetical protein
MSALGLGNVATAIRSYIVRNPRGTMQFTLDVHAPQLNGIAADAYQANGKPAPEPHLKDKRNYESFAQSVVTVVGPVDTVAQTFEQYFRRYSDWLEFNRVVTDEQGSTRPGDRLSIGDANGDNWPEDYPPADKATRLMAQSYILAGQAFMNFCAALEIILSAIPGADTTQKYDKLYVAVAQTIRKDVPFPTYFLKPSMIGLLSLAGISLQVDGDLPGPNVTGAFTVSLKSCAADAGACAVRQRRERSKNRGYGGLTAQAIHKICHRYSEGGLERAL